VPERSSQEQDPLETLDSQRLAGRVCSHFISLDEINTWNLRACVNNILNFVDEAGIVKGRGSMEWGLQYALHNLLDVIPRVSIFLPEITRAQAWLDTNDSRTVQWVPSARTPTDQISKSPFHAPESSDSECIQSRPDDSRLPLCAQKAQDPLMEDQVDCRSQLLAQSVEGSSGIISANVRGEVSLLAFGTKACSAGDVPKVLKGQGLAPPPRSAYIFEDGSLRKTICRWSPSSNPN
jgi:hypothetical protein